MQIHRTFDACGNAVLPASECVALQRFYRVPIILAAGEVAFDITQVAVKDFLWRGISRGGSEPQVKLRFRAAKQYYLSNARARASLIMGSGFESRALNRELLIPKGQAVTIEAENLTGDAVNTYVTLVGVDLEVPNYGATAL